MVETGIWRTVYHSGQDASLQRAFAEVRALLYPRWDRAYRWRIATRRNRHGRDEDYGSGETRWIVISPDIAACGGEPLRLQIASEIAHAITGPAGGKRFRARMRKAAMVAHAHGKTELAALLEQEADAGGAVPRFDDDVRLIVEDILMEIPGSSREGVVRMLSGALGLKPDELDRRYRRLRRIQEAAPKEPRPPAAADNLPRRSRRRRK
jgi:hypothetical protein